MSVLWKNLLLWVSWEFKVMLKSSLILFQAKIAMETNVQA